MALEPKTRKKKKPASPDIELSLRDDAEKRLKRSRNSLPDLNDQDKEKIIHELQVHQIELEMQNEALRETHLALEESWDKYVDLYEFAPLGYLTLTDKAIIREANLTSATLLGIERDKLRKGRFSKYVDETDGIKWHQFFINVLKQTEKRTSTLMLHRDDGTQFPARLEAVPIRGSNGELSVRLAISDITEIRVAEDAVRESEEKYRGLFDAESDGIVLVIRKTGIILDCNDAFALMCGYRKDELIGQPNTMISAEPEATRATTEAGTRHIPIRYYKRKDGSIFPVEITTSHVALHGHNIIIGAVRDITDRKKIEDVLKVSEQRLRSALNSGRSGVWEWDLGTEENFWSDELWDLYGIARNSFTPSHETWLKTVRPENREKIEGAVMEAVRTGSDLNIEWLVDTNDGTYRWLMSRGRPVKDSTGAVVKYIGVVIDITERKRAEEELTRKNYEVESANEELTITGEELRKNEAKLTASLEEKEALLSEIHHRVKNNLAAFISLLSLEGSYEATERGTALRKDLQNRARSMALIHETIYKTKKFSSVDMGVYLQTLTDHVAVTYRTDTSVRTVVNAGGFSLDLNRSTPCGLIVNELITNAFKYAFPASFSCESARKEPCTIWVTFTLENGYYLLSVRDNGVGLPETFDPVTAKSLGLKLVNFLAKHQLRANIEVSRKEGTEFLIRFRENL